MTEADESTYGYTITGTINALDESEALTRLQRILKAAGFVDSGDDRLWLARPQTPHDDVGFALAGIEMYVNDLDVVYDLDVREVSLE